jgi:hypothetical protein
MMRKALKDIPRCNQVLKASEASHVMESGLPLAVPDAPGDIFCDLSLILRRGMTSNACIRLSQSSTGSPGVKARRRRCRK